MRRASGPHLVLVTGLPGTGKSTMADVAATELGAPVLGHDWAMSGLRPYPELQAALDAMGLRGHRGVGWSILWALARSGLRRGLPVVLDGVARAPEVAETRALAAAEGAPSFVVMTECSDPELTPSAASREGNAASRAGTSWSGRTSRGHAANGPPSTTSIWCSRPACHCRTTQGRSGMP